MQGISVLMCFDLWCFEGLLKALHRFEQFLLFYFVAARVRT